MVYRDCLTAGQLIALFKKYNIPADATIEIDSGWECGPVDSNDVFYYVVENRIFITSSGKEDEYLNSYDIIHLELDIPDYRVKDLF